MEGLNERSFGEKLAGVEYRDRVGAYAIIFDAELKVPVVQTSTGCFLLGGGLDAGESHADCIRRECLEEAGLAVDVGPLVCKGDKYHWSDTLGYYMHGVGYFYLAKSHGQVATPKEEDHELVWMAAEQCIDSLFLEHQAWAVEQALRLVGNAEELKRD